MLTFDDYRHLTNELASALVAALEADGIRCRYGASNQSCSAYVEATYNDDGDSIKARFSDHDDRHGSDFTIRIDRLVTTIEDECGEYVATQIPREAFDAAVAQARINMIDRIKADA